MIINIQNVVVDNKMLEQHHLQISYVPAPPQPQNIVPVADASKNSISEYNVSYNANLTTKLWLLIPIYIYFKLG